MVHNTYHMVFAALAYTTTLTRRRRRPPANTINCHDSIRNHDYNSGLMTTLRFVITRFTPRLMSYQTADCHRADWQMKARMVKRRGKGWESDAADKQVCILQHWQSRCQG